MDRVIEKVKDLLRLGRSENVNEAAAAMAAAQRLMERHRLDQAMLDVSGPEAEGAHEEIEHGELARMRGGTVPRWRWIVARALCVANACKGYTQTRWIRDRPVKSIQVIGRASDAQTVRYLFDYLIAEIDRLTRQAAKTAGAPGLTWCNSFRLGAAIEIAARIGEATTHVRAEARESARSEEALVRVEGALARLQQHEDALEEYGQRVLNLRPSPARPLVSLDVFAFGAGRRAAASITLSPGRPLPSGPKGSLPDG